jgi:uncharacterized cupredoxin-like copper-binding protein
MYLPLPRRRDLAIAAALAGLILTGCSTGSSNRSNAGDGPGMMGDGTAYRASTRTCTAPRTLPGTRVEVTMGDRGMTRMMSGDAPRGAMMRLRASPTHVGAGRITFVVSNRGWRTHELLVLPLQTKASPGPGLVSSNGRVSETGSLGEASRSCGPGAAAGITAGSAGWTTMTLRPGRYELVCNLRNHYMDGMRQTFVVS